MNHFTKSFGVLLAAFVLSACSVDLNPFSNDDDAPMEGERISVLELQKTIEPDDKSYELEGLMLPKAWRNQFWPQVGGYPNHSMQNLELNPGPLKEIWSTTC